MAFGLTTKIEQYVFRKALGAFLLTTVVLTVIIWITQALRKIDLVSSKGQTLELYLVVSSLAVPSLIVVLAPVALLIAVIYAINALHQDSEIIVIASAGGSPKRVTRPLLWLSLLVAILTGVLSISVAPKGLSQLRGYITQVRADLIASIMVPGGFTDVDDGIMVHIKERGSDGSLSGILISDTRNPEASFQYLASRGAIVEAGIGTYLIMQNGTTTIGLFQGMFPNNILTFNPGWNHKKETLEKFQDVRELQAAVKAKGITPVTSADPDSTGPASFVIVDPDGNSILVDQHVPKPKQ